nr:MAG TPA: hypothetical protein [Caudoviricetes sp.]
MMCYYMFMELIISLFENIINKNNHQINLPVQWWLL